MYDAAEAAAILRVSLRTLGKVVKAGRLHPQGYARQHLFFGRELCRFLNEEGN